MRDQSHYCLECGYPGGTSASFCPNCGRTTAVSRRERTRGLAFLLNEVTSPAFDDLVEEDERGRIFDRYDSELTSLAGLSSGAVSRATHTPDRTAPAFRTPSPPPISSGDPAEAPLAARAPRDWSWLAEQQANLFLFAGAFLVVVAALIYVGYSKQAVSGPLKMGLFVAYTLAFIGAGALCLRYPRVAIAGRVFLGVGALLVPLNFVAASNIFRDEKLNAEAMWLAGSMTTVAFYSFLAALGAGRNYAFGAGIAIFSATAAAIVIADLPRAWAPLCFLLVAIAVIVGDALAPQRIRERITSTWSLQTHVVAALAVTAASLVALRAADGHHSLHATRSFLPLTFAVATAYALAAFVRHTRRDAAAAGLLMLGGTLITVVYATHSPAEYYAVAIAAIALIFGLMSAAVKQAPLSRLLPDDAASALSGIAVALTLASFAIALLTARAASSADSDFTLHTRWFMFVSAALILAFYSFDALVHRKQPAVYGTALSIVGLSASVVYSAHIGAAYYATALAAPALLIAVLASAPARLSVERVLPQNWRPNSLSVGRVVIVVAALVAFVAALAVDARWIMTSTFAIALVFYLLDAFAHRNRNAPAAIAIALVSLSVSIVFGSDVNAEYYAFALVVPALLLVSIERGTLGTRLDSLLARGWRADGMVVARLAAGAGALVACLAAAAGADSDTAWQPQTHIYLPLAFACVAAFFVLDASRAKREDLSAALLASLAGLAAAIVYAARLDPPYYGIAFVAAAFVFAFGGRIWSPSWLDERVRDAAAAITVTAGWLPFEQVYLHAPREAAATHLAAALFYAVAALSDPTSVTLNELLELRDARPVRVGVAWLYAAGLTLTAGYIFVLRALPSTPDDATSGSLAMPFLGITLAFICAAASTRWCRNEFRPHLYVMALLLAVTTIALSSDATALSVTLTVLMVAFVLAAAWENAPLLLAPAAVFGLAAVSAWQMRSDVPVYIIPAAFSGIALGAYALGYGVLYRSPQWSAALRAVGGVYALAAPAAGFVILAANTHHGRYGTAPFEESALYQVSTGAVALVAILAIAEASIWRRGWLLVAGTSMLAVAALIQIGRFDPDSTQPYTLIAGAYLVLLGVFGLSRLHLIPQLDDIAPVAEAAGAALIMGPAFLHSLGGHWFYQVLVLAEAVLFFAAGVSLRRRVLLAIAISFMVLDAGRALVDAIHALPNWIVIMIAGMALLGIGMGILLGRERWTRWQDALAHWWQRMDDENARVAPNAG